jgi:hypothetical protein
MQRYGCPGWSCPKDAKNNSDDSGPPLTRGEMAERSNPQLARTDANHESKSTISAMTIRR